MHGTKLMSWSEVRETYGRELVNLRNEGRYTFLNTLFSVSEAVLYMQAWHPVLCVLPELMSGNRHHTCVPQRGMKDVPCAPASNALGTHRVLPKLPFGNQPCLSL